jgi:hypothetical protein
MKEHNWHRRHALQLACQLPEDSEDALIVLRMATQFMTDFLAEPGPTKKPAPVLVSFKDGMLKEVHWAMADDDKPRHASEIPEWEVEEMIREVIEQTMRADIAERALAWIDMRKGRLSAALRHAAVRAGVNKNLSPVRLTTGLATRRFPLC